VAGYTLVRSGSKCIHFDESHNYSNKPHSVLLYIVTFAWSATHFSEKSLSVQQRIDMSEETSYPTPEFYNPPIIILFYRVGYSFTFLLGFISNTASLATFSRPKLRKVSTGCLFMVLAISDILYLFMCVFDYLEFGFQVMIIHRAEQAPSLLVIVYRFRSSIMLITVHSVDFVLL
jgi:hypothetical protein